MTTVLHWFRRDLRLSDNTALAAASQAADQVIGLYVLDPRLLATEKTCQARLAFLYSALAELAENLAKKGGYLLIRHGQPEEELPRCVAAIKAAAVYYNRDYSSFARRRDSAVEKALQAAGCPVYSFKDLVLFEKDELLTATSQPYTVFTPYKKSWLAAITAKPPLKKEVHAESLQLTPEVRANLETLGSGNLGLPTPPDGYEKAFFMPASEKAARAILKEWAGEKPNGQPPIERYAEDRNLPALTAATSRLSPHLRFGTISAATCYRAAVNARDRAERVAQKDGCDFWISELIWREFYNQILWNFPHVAHGAFQKKYSALEWKENREHFEAWCQGQTGYPIVDAAMRQLNTINWMHNRLRMITASFLTKDLLLNWQLGEAYFRQKLVDYDQASNNGGWQWSASTGTDAQPYFRIFNPTSQSEKFDPQGEFIRAWLPELARVPSDYIHEPSRMPLSLQQHLGVLIGRDYPAPIVDHKTAREKALKLFKI